MSIIVRQQTTIKPLAIKIPILNKEAQKKEYYIKNIYKDNENWNGWTFQIHRNRLDWVVPKIRNVKKTIFVHLPTSFI